MEGTADAVRGTTILFAQSVLSGLLRVVNIMVLARVLLQIQMGQVAILGIVYGFMQFLGTLGLNHAAPLFVPEEEESGHLDRVKGFLKRSVGIISVSSVVLVLVVLLASDIIVASGTITRDLLLLVLIVAPFSSLEVFLDSFLLARYQTQRLAAGRVLFDVARVLATISLVFLGSGVAGVALGWLAGECVAVLVFGVFAVRGLPASSSYVDIRPVLAFGLPSLLFQTVDVTIQNTDRIVLLYVTDLQTLAVYDVMLSVLFMMSFASLGISTALYPVLTRLRIRHESGGDVEKSFSIPVGHLIRYILLLLVPVSVIGALNSHDILLLLFGSTYANFPDAALAFALLVLFYSLWGVTYALHSVLRSLGEARFFALVGLAIIAVELIGCWYLTAWIGLLGTTLVRCLYITLLLGSALLRLKQHRLTIRSTLNRSLVRIPVAALLAALLVYLLNPPDLIQLVVMLVAAMMCYILLLFLFREVNETDLRLARNIFPPPLDRAVQWIEKRYLGR